MSEASEQPRIPENTEFGALIGTADESIALSTEGDGVCHDANPSSTQENEDWEDDLQNLGDFDSELEEQFYQAPTVEIGDKRLTDAAIIASVVASLSPGTALFFARPCLRGILLNLLLAFGVFAIACICNVWALFPVPLVVAWGIVVIMVWVAGFVHTLKTPLFDVRFGESWRQGMMAFGAFWMPLILSFCLSTQFGFQRTWMSNDTMMPSMKRGDIILVDQSAYRKNDPTYGDLVLVEERFTEQGTEQRRAYFGRIIALPGDNVQLFGVQPAVNGKQLTQYLRQFEADVYDRNILSYELPYGTETDEQLREPDKWYPVMAPNQLLLSQTNMITLENGYYYILEDNRKSGRKRTRTSYGSIIHRSEIKGQPQYVIYNTLDDNPFERYGIALR